MDKKHIEIAFVCVEGVRKAYDMPAQQISLLLLVALNPGITMPEVGETLAMPQGTVSRNVSILEKRYGLVVTRQDTNIDVRRYALWLTKKGEGLLEKL